MKGTKRHREPEETKHMLSTSSWVSAFQLPLELQITDSTFAELVTMKPTERRAIRKMFGKPCFQNYYSRNFGVSYRYAGKLYHALHVIGKTHEAEALDHPYLKSLLEWAQTHSGKKMNQLLVNWYMDGSQYVGWHADDEKDIDPTAPIYSFSFGAERLFRFAKRSVKSHTRKDIVWERRLQHNGCVVMGGDCQKEFKHTLHKELRVKTLRINVTIRALLL